jgi:hypothetical protein
VKAIKHHASPLAPHAVDYIDISHCFLK